MALLVNCKTNEMEMCWCCVLSPLCGDFIDPLLKLEKMSSFALTVATLWEYYTFVVINGVGWGWGGAKWLLILWTSWFTIFPSSVLLCLIFHSSAPHALLLLSFVSTFPSLSLSTLTCCTAFPVNTSPVLVPYCPALHKTQCKPFFSLPLSQLS